MGVSFKAGVQIPGRGFPGTPGTRRALRCADHVRRRRRDTIVTSITFLHAQIRRSITQRWTRRCIFLAPANLGVTVP